jgi:hypothetical protein
MLFPDDMLRMGYLQNILAKIPLLHVSGTGGPSLPFHDIRKPPAAID